MRKSCSYVYVYSYIEIAQNVAKSPKINWGQNCIILFCLHWPSWIKVRPLFIHYKMRKRTCVQIVSENYIFVLSSWFWVTSAACSSSSLRPAQSIFPFSLFCLRKQCYKVQFGWVLGPQFIVASSLAKKSLPCWSTWCFVPSFPPFRPWAFLETVYWLLKDKGNLLSSLV